ncbi:hypothetical protein [Phenylobacterium sp. J367]|uniref:hypothetical protein n=1 Tax=Phenylobacterium sp. J367 TaxID=2898435 RepID=UPI0021513626|nr:hypothetical protein [Phenylobacterium sp. J367]MCR5880732.1 hypothetical protein [Phenylobacterium sp. J367]
MAAGLLLSGCASISPACSGDFDAFLARFGEDVAFQREFTSPTVVVTASEPGGIAEQVITRRAKSDLTFPLMPPAAERRRLGLVEKAEHNGPRATFRFARPDSDAHSMSFTFERRGCWALTQIDDQSL